MAISGYLYQIISGQVEAGEKVIAIWNFSVILFISNAINDGALAPEKETSWGWAVPSSG